MNRLDAFALIARTAPTNIALAAQPSPLSIEPFPRPRPRPDLDR
jgi:hypothetical protein